MSKSKGLLFSLLAVASTLTAEQAKEHKGQRDKHCCPVLCTTNPFPVDDNCCFNFHVDIGLIYQQPTMPGMFPGIVYEVTRDETVGSITYEYEEGADLLPCFNYALGVTASLGYVMKHDNWYLGARFDWLSESISRVYNYTDEPTKSIYLPIPFWTTQIYNALNQLDDEEFSRLTYTAGIDIYALDVLMSRGSYHSHYFSYEPYAGVKALWFHTYQKSLTYQTDGEGDDETGNINPVQNNWGVGPMFGFNGEFHCTDYIAIFSDSDIALLFGEANLTTTVIRERYESTALTEDDRATIKNNIGCQNYVVARSILGVKLSTYCFEDSHYLALKLGYDVRSVISYGENDRGFSLNGLYADLIWNF